MVAHVRAGDRRGGGGCSAARVLPHTRHSPADAQHAFATPSAEEAALLQPHAPARCLWCGGPCSRGAAELGIVLAFWGPTCVSASRCSVGGVCTGAGWLVGQWDHIRECLLGGREGCSRAVLLYSVICLSFATCPASSRSATSRPPRPQPSPAAVRSRPAAGLVCFTADSLPHDSPGNVVSGHLASARSNVRSFLLCLRGFILQQTLVKPTNKRSK
jgi:hypothetical protein